MTTQHTSQKVLDRLTELLKAQHEQVQRAETLLDEEGLEHLAPALKSMRKTERRLARSLGRLVAGAIVNGARVRLLEHENEVENENEVEHEHENENENEVVHQNEVENENENDHETEHRAPSLEAESAPAKESATLVSPPPKPSSAALQALKTKFDAPATESSPPASDAPEVSSHMRTLDKITQGPLQLGQLSHVQTWVTDMDLLLSLPREHQRLAGTLLVARLRGLQERHGNEVRGIGDLFSQLTRWSAAHRPGVIHGLARSHSPHGGSWDAEAEATRDQLWDRPGTETQAHHSSTSSSDRMLHQFTEVPASSLNDAALRSVVAELLRAGVSSTHPRMINWLQGRAEALLGDGTLSSTRKAVECLEDDDSDDNTSSGPDESWPYWHLCKGKVAVMLGGDPRDDSRKAIEKAFSLQRLIWVDPKDDSLHALRDRLEKGTIDLLIINRFCKHKDTDVVLPAVRTDLSRWVRVPHGYGITAIQHHMERQWGQFARGTEELAESA